MKKGQEPAFPTDYAAQSAWTGLSRRQWYAGRALAWHGCWTSDAEVTAKRCFKVADAMIEFEEKEKNGTKKNN